MTLSIVNNMEETGHFSSSISIEPDDAKSGFKGEGVEIGPFDSHNRVFSVVPGTSSRLYTVTAVVESGGIEHSATSFITIDEMVADALREAEGLGDKARLETDSFIMRHASSPYGSDLQQYKSLKETLAAAKESRHPQYNNTTETEHGGEGEETVGLSWLLAPVMIASGVIVAVLLFIRTRGRKKESDTEYY